MARPLSLLARYGQDTLARTTSSLKLLPPEITLLQDGSKTPIDILHIEEHGDATTSSIGGTPAATFVDEFPNPGMALLWSCYSGAANSWGESPALDLHRGQGLDGENPGAPFVLSFQAELHYADADSISARLYSETFGAAATRDPESALVAIRADKYRHEFPFGNWASMTVFQRQPLDLSAMTLSGVRVPAARWDDQPVTAGDPLAPAWKNIGDAILHLQPGRVRTLDDLAAVDAVPQLPLSIAEAWRGNVILLDAGVHPLPDDLLRELSLDPAEAPALDADRLVWFFDLIRPHGTPLVIWTGARPEHEEFLRFLKPSSSIAILLLTGKESALSIADLSDRTRYAEALALYRSAPPGSLTNTDCVGAYFALCRGGGSAAEAEVCIAALTSSFEQTLLSGNFVSRFETIPRLQQDTVATAGLNPLLKRQAEEDCYRRAIQLATGDTGHA